MKSKYREYLNSDEWKSKRLQKLKLNPKCEVCGDKSNINIHHKTYDRIFNENIEDLQTLCRLCHKKAHGISISENIYFYWSDVDLLCVSDNYSSSGLNTCIDIYNNSDRKTKGRFKGKKCTHPVKNIDDWIVMCPGDFMDEIYSDQYEHLSNEDRVKIILIASIVICSANRYGHVKGFTIQDRLPYIDDKFLMSLNEIRGFNVEAKEAVSFCGRYIEYRVSYKRTFVEYMGD